MAEIGELSATPVDIVEGTKFPVDQSGTAKTTSIGKIKEYLDENLDFTGNEVINTIQDDILNIVAGELSESISYSLLVQKITDKTLIKGRKYSLEIQETWTGGSKAAEQIVVTASSADTLERVVASITNPNDYIEYTVDNTLITGATKGVILKRIDSSGNEFGVSYGNTISLSNINNKFDNNFYSNIFDTYCDSNKFGAYCHSNQLGYSCYSNIFAKRFTSNTLSYYCYSNTFGDDCYSNTFGYYFHKNSLSDGCKSNVFGNLYKYNTFTNISNCNFTTTYSLFEPYLKASYPCDVYLLPNGSVALDYTNDDGIKVTVTL